MRKPAGKLLTLEATDMVPGNSISHDGDIMIKADVLRDMTIETTNGKVVVEGNVQDGAEITALYDYYDIDEVKQMEHNRKVSDTVMNTAAVLAEAFVPGVSLGKQVFDEIRDEYSQSREGDAQAFAIKIEGEVGNHVTVSSNEGIHYRSAGDGLRINATGRVVGTGFTGKDAVIISTDDAIGLMDIDDNAYISAGTSLQLNAIGDNSTAVAYGGEAWISGNVGDNAIIASNDSIMLFGDVGADAKIKSAFGSVDMQDIGAGSEVYAYDFIGANNVGDDVTMIMHHENMGMSLSVQGDVGERFTAWARGGVHVRHSVGADAAIASHESDVSIGHNLGEGSLVRARGDVEVNIISKAAKIEAGGNIEAQVIHKSADLTYGGEVNTLYGGPEQGGGISR